MLTTLFWISFGLIFYIYIGYPLSLWFFSLFSRKTPQKGPFYPTVSILIPAYNEASVIKKTIENKLALNYPQEKLSICVISDGSTDQTEQIVKTFHPQGVTLLTQPKRQGKTSALNKAVIDTGGDIIVFSDANSIYDKDALLQLMQNFIDPSIGYVTGKMLYINPDRSLVGDGCNSYMKYENYLRELETHCGSIVGVDGGIDAIKRELYAPMPSNALPDFFLPLNVVEQGYRVVYEPNAILEEQALSSAKDEFSMRTRVALRAFDTLWTMKHLLNPLKYKLFSYQLLFHKLFRYTTGLVLIFLFFSNFLLALENHPVYAILFGLQIGMYFLAVIGFLTEKLNVHLSFIYPIYYFCLLHFSSTIAFFRFLMGEKKVLWEPRKG